MQAHFRAIAKSCGSLVRPFPSTYDNVILSPRIKCRFPCPSFSPRTRCLATKSTASALLHRRSTSLPAHSTPLLRQSGLFWQPHRHISPKPGEDSLSDPRAFSSAIMCRPIKAHAFTVSAEMQDPNSTNSRRLCANAHCPKHPNRPKHFPTMVCPTSLAPCLSPVGHRPLKTISTKRSRANSQP